MRTMFRPTGAALFRFPLIPWLTPLAKDYRRSAAGPEFILARRVEKYSMGLEVWPLPKPFPSSGRTHKRASTPQGAALAYARASDT